MGQNLKTDFFEKLLTIRYETTLTNMVNQNEPPSISYEIGKKLEVVISKATKTVSTIQEGIMAVIPGIYISI